MPKTKSLVIFLSVAIIFSLFAFVVNSAVAQQGQNQGGSQNQQQDQQQNQEQQQQQEQEQQQEQGRVRGQTNAQQHRSVVANFVQSLVHIADREPGGIGEQVRTIAQQQNQSASTTVQAMERVENRNRIRTFLFGSDYKNLGALRSEMVQTRNRLEQLNRVMANIENEEDMVQLQNQIQEMEQEQLRIENFIREQEGKFSFFGWLSKLIYGYQNLED